MLSIYCNNSSVKFLAKDLQIEKEKLLRKGCAVQICDLESDVVDFT